MGKIWAVTHVSLDGVMQGPGRADEDPRDGFRHGGWSVPYGDEVMRSSVGPGQSSDQAGEGGLLLGRFTYELLYASWSGRTDDNPFTDRLNAAQKYVVSETLADPLPWEHSTRLHGDVMAAVTALKRRLPSDLTVIGSGRLLQSLLRHDLVDELLLTIHPLILGSGHRLFPTEGPRLALRLTETKPTTTGVIVARYELSAATN
jgi:dihydrofolate reductase